MLSIKRLASAILPLCMFGAAQAGSDVRELGQLPSMMQEYIMSNMRDHLVALNDILSKMAAGDLEAAAETAESRPGMSALEAHGASHTATFMPEGMQSPGTQMHRAASRFGLKAQEGEALPAYRALSEVTASFVACHEAYRIR